MTTEWTVVTVIIALVGLFLTVGKPVINLNNSLTKNTVETSALRDTFEKFCSKNSESHDRLWKHNECQDKTIADHETRITVIENNTGSK
jgi:hypothetical protein